MMRFAWTFILLSSIQVCSAYEFCVNTGSACVDGPSTRTINGLAVTRDCWEIQDTYTCYDPPTSTCDAIDLTQWVYEGTSNQIYLNGDVNQPILGWDDYYSNNERWVLTCDDPAANLYCAGNPNCDLAPLDCQVTTPQACSDSSPSIREPNADGAQVFRTCWAETTAWQCYGGDTSVVCDAPPTSCEWTGFVCNVDDLLKIPEPTYGTCVDWTDQYACTQNATTTCDADTTLGCDTAVTATTNDLLNGTPINWTTVQTCYTGPANSCNSDPDCALTTVACTAYANPPENTICTEQQQNYTCSTTTTECLDNIVSTSCASVNTAGTDEVAYNGQSNINQAIEAMAYVDMVQRDQSVDGAGTIRVFAGESQECKDITNTGRNLVTSICAGGTSFGVTAWAGLFCLALLDFDLKCCKDNPDDIEIGKDYTICDDDDVTLASARDADRAHRVDGPYDTFSPCLIAGLGGCSWGPSLEEKQMWCMFDSVLSRIIQEQGREQLELMASSSAAGTTAYDINFEYSSGSGGWSVPVDINGTEMRYWQYDTACQDPATLSAAIRDSTIVCPIRDVVWMAYCSNTSGNCGTLPGDPRIGAGSSEWTVHGLDPHKNLVTAMTRYVVANGECTASTADPNWPGSCAYHFDAWPLGAGGQLLTQVDISWPMYYMSEGWFNDVWASGLYEFQPYSFDMNLPKTQTSIDFHYRVAGDPWSVETLPLEIPATGYSLPGTPTPVTIYGACDIATNTCTYRVQMSTTVTAKPWGDRDTVDCSGFTLEEIQVLDFDSMDLSEYIASFDTPTVPNQAALIEAATNNVADYYTSYSNNTPIETGAAQTKVVEIQPANGFGPFDVIAYVATTWQIQSGGTTNSVPVTASSIDWGDGSTSTPSMVNNKMQASHTYPRVSADTTYDVSVTFVTADGTFTETAQVLSWRDPPTADGTGSGGAQGGESTYLPQDLPGGSTSTISPPVIP